MDISRTGCRAAASDDVAESLGTMRGKAYTAPNGRTFRRGCTPVVAKILLAAQPRMAHLKAVVATSTREMVRDYPESELSNWFIDELMRAVADSTGRQVDVGISNFGGIRVDMPEGDVLLDDIRSMFPFNNKICYVELPGKDLVALMEQIAQFGPQCVSGVKMVISDKKLESLEVGGKPVDPKKKYGVATVDFLLDGGDNISVARGATKLIITEVIIGRAIEQYIRNLTAEGKAIEYQTDGRVVVK
jgi:2',3'-cyclic-nucleotide 2'-phosphodiesterase (5'-nucleotidase family)